MMYVKEISALIFCCLVSVTWTDSDSVRLIDIEALTLCQGLMTKGRRSSPIPQLKCVGGTAGCSEFILKVVQCINRGSDGTDVQWECKADMDNAYHFGQISVSCEGYNYANDPYILIGSCGLEYTLDLAKEGHQQQNSAFKKNNRGIYSNSIYFSLTVDFSSLNHWLQRIFLWVLGILVFIPLFGLVVYGLYILCIAPSSEGLSQQRNDDFGRGYPNDGNRYPASNAKQSSSKPSAPGFRPEFTQSDTTCGGATAQSSGSGIGEGGFWARVATPEVLSSIFGEQNIRNRGETSTRTESSSSVSSTSSGTRTASGFGGTTRSPTDAPSTGTRTASGFGTTTRRGSDSSSSIKPLISSNRLN